MKFIGIVGSRRRHTLEDYNLILQVLDAIYSPNDELVSGGCSEGADFFAELIARERCIRLTVLNADWRLHGMAAGHIRNRWIAEMVDVLIALTHHDRTGGTESTIKAALFLRKKVIYV